ncbi:hypothetical protein L3Q67_26415 [Saccharothrix sp. AJ9571]|nr:hypothetical protein L3Q67_26415 [Saccharothrix sp. AJ9571]
MVVLGVTACASQIESRAQVYHADPVRTARDVEDLLADELIPAIIDGHVKLPFLWSQRQVPYVVRCPVGRVDRAIDVDGAVLEREML